MDKGTSFGAPCALENELAKMVIDAVPSVEMVRFTNSGTEACMGVLRLMRAYTKREKVIKFEGCYHGHADSFLVAAGSGVITSARRSRASPRAPRRRRRRRHNDLDSVEELLKANKDEVAGVILEGVVGNSGFIVPDKEFLVGLRALCDKCVARRPLPPSPSPSAASSATSAPPPLRLHRASATPPAGRRAPIFDEVMTGFRLVRRRAAAWGSARPLHLRQGDGGGLPVGAYAGKKEIMQEVAPAGPMYQAGTLSGNPLAMTAGIETLKRLKQPGTYEQLDQMTDKLINGILDAAKEAGHAVCGGHISGMFGFFCRGRQVVRRRHRLRHGEVRAVAPGMLERAPTSRCRSTRPGSPARAHRRRHRPHGWRRRPSPRPEERTLREMERARRAAG